MSPAISLASDLFQEVDWLAVFRVMGIVFPIWIFGAVVGMLMPRPRWLQGAKSWSMVLGSLSSAPWLRQLTLMVHAGMILREVWNYCTDPGTFRGLLAAVATWLKGGRFEWPSTKRIKADPEAVAPVSGWYISKEDLEFFKDRVERDAPLPGAGEWELICDKSTDELEYIAYRRTLPNGTTEYKSTTISYDATAEEFLDFYLDDPSRPAWDNMITHYEVVENGDFAQRDQVVRWVRSFPFSFLSDREYIMGRRAFRENGACYGITKTVRHPAAPQGRIVRVDDCHSMWRSRTIPSPRGGGEVACETVLLHCENMKIPERLARFAVRHGMWGFVKKMGPCTRKFLAERRTRVSSYEQDPTAYGSVPARPSAPMGVRRGSAVSLGSVAEGVSSPPPSRASSSDLASIGELEELGKLSPSSGGGMRRTDSGSLRRSPSARKIGALLALGMAVSMGPGALKRSRSTGVLTHAKGIQRRLTSAAEVPASPTSPADLPLSTAASWVGMEHASAPASPKE